MEKTLEEKRLEAVDARVASFDLGDDLILPVREASEGIEDYVARCNEVIVEEWEGKSALWAPGVMKKLEGTTPCAPHAKFVTGGKEVSCMSHFCGNCRHVLSLRVRGDCPRVPEVVPGRELNVVGKATFPKGQLVLPRGLADEMRINEESIVAEAKRVITEKYGMEAKRVRKQKEIRDKNCKDCVLKLHGACGGYNVWDVDQEEDGAKELACSRKNLGELTKEICQDIEAKYGLTNFKRDLSACDKFEYQGRPGGCSRTIKHYRSFPKSPGRIMIIKSVYPRHMIAFENTKGLETDARKVSDDVAAVAWLLRGSFPWGIGEGTRHGRIIGHYNDFVAVKVLKTYSMKKPQLYLLSGNSTGTYPTYYNDIGCAMRQVPHAGAEIRGMVGVGN